MMASVAVNVNVYVIYKYIIIYILLIKKLTKKILRFWRKIKPRTHDECGAFSCVEHGSDSGQEPSGGDSAISNQRHEPTDFKKSL